MLPEHCSILTPGQDHALEQVLTGGIRLYVAFIDVSCALLCVDALWNHVLRHTVYILCCPLLALASNTLNHT